MTQHIIVDVDKMRKLFAEWHTDEYETPNEVADYTNRLTARVIEETTVPGRFSNDVTRCVTNLRRAIARGGPEKIAERFSQLYEQLAEEGIIHG